jgi:hypothetical protein
MERRAILRSTSTPLAIGLSPSPLNHRRRASCPGWTLTVVPSRATGVVPMSLANWPRLTGPISPAHDNREAGSGSLAHQQTQHSVARTLPVVPGVWAPRPHDLIAKPRHRGPRRTSSGGRSADREEVASSLQRRLSIDIDRLPSSPTPSTSHDTRARNPRGGLDMTRRNNWT